jgi:hypothetical protein
MVVVCGEIEEKIGDDIGTETNDEKHRKPRYICGEGKGGGGKNMIFSFCI